jgi:small subunit ribosomal protein S17
MSTKAKAVKAKAKSAAAPAAAKAEAPAAAPSAKVAKTLTGKVVSTKMQKTISVLIQRYVPHATYGKYQRRTTQLLAHDENSESRTGDLVSIEQCRPMSRHKSWRLVKVLERGPQSDLGADQAEEATP